MRCSNDMMKYTGYLHILALMIAIYGTYRQIDAVKGGEPFSPALSIALTVMLALRIPNQICVALKESHGWYSVIGTVVGAAAGKRMLVFACVNPRWSGMEKSKRLLVR